MSHYVFGYGSLMWKPGFEFVSIQTATLKGYHRSLCISSHVHRGTKENSGLVMGLDEGGECTGVVYEIAAPQWQATYEYLTAREMINKVYSEEHLSLTLSNGSLIKNALVYVVDRSHAQYTGKLAAIEQANRIRHAVGVSGKNPDYVLETVKALRNMQIYDEALEAVLALL